MRLVALDINTTAIPSSVNCPRIRRNPTWSRTGSLWSSCVRKSHF